MSYDVAVCSASARNAALSGRSRRSRLVFGSRQRSFLEKGLDVLADGIREGRVTLRCVKK